MFAADRFIDTVQDGKKYFVTTFVTDDSVRAPLYSFIEAQRVFTKQVVKTGNDLMSVFTDSMLKMKTK